MNEVTTMRHKNESSQANKNPMYLYFINYRIGQKQLCTLEMKAIFDIELVGNFIISSFYIDPSRSIFINGRMDIIATGETVTDLESNVVNMKLEFEQYKIRFVNMGEYVEYDERLKALRTIGFAIEGEFAIKNPLITLALTKASGKWIFGYYTRNDNEWVNRKQKPFNYSYALDVQLAKTIINIAVKNNKDLKVIDPCCGVGTVLIEGKLMGVNIKGFDLNESVVNHCNGNLKHFNLPEDAIYKDMLTITDNYDVAILDLPYGQFSLTSTKEQKALLIKTKELAKKSIIISMEDLSVLIKESGFTIKDTCLVTKSNAFSRYLYVCN